MLCEGSNGKFLCMKIFWIKSSEPPKKGTPRQMVELGLLVVNDFVQPTSSSSITEALPASKSLNSNSRFMLNNQKEREEHTIE